MMKTKIAIASDHAGFKMKLEMIVHLEKEGYEVCDYGTDTEDSVDYPDYGHALAESVEKGVCGVGISLCGSGNGINMTTNKHQGIRGALCWNREISILARKHNDANVCSIPARFLDQKLAEDIVDLFLTTDCEGGRHSRRIDKIPQ
jgi:ribose 5-phosphate isomerase B